MQNGEQASTLPPGVKIVVKIFSSIRFDGFRL